MIRVNLNTLLIGNRLTQASRSLTDMTPIHQDIGEYVVKATRDRFVNSTAPDGTRWRDKQPATITRYKARGDGNRPKPLIGPSGRLSKEIAMHANRDEVEVGSALEYSGVMQDGAARGAFGNDKADHPLPWGTIPARVWLGLSDIDERTILDIVERHVAAAFDE